MKSEYEKFQDRMFDAIEEAKERAFTKRVEDFDRLIEDFERRCDAPALTKSDIESLQAEWKRIRALADELIAEERGRKSG